jgi:dTDP-4-dehydrorhamnose reductase
MMAARWLIIGGSGYIGSHLRRFLGASAIATYHRSPFPGGIRFDGTSERLADRILPDAKGVEAAFILQAMSRIDDCARDPEKSRAVNVEAVQRMVEELETAGIVPVFASSDAVLDGTGHAVSEAVQPRPLMLYGRQKAEVESFLAARGSRSITVRLAKVVGTDRHVSNLISNWLDQIERGETIHCATDQVFSPILVDDVCAALVTLVERRVEGLFNLGGPRPICRFELLGLLTEAMSNYRFGVPQIVPCRLNDLPFSEPRPLDQSMDVSKLTAVLGRSPVDMAEVCQQAAALRYSSQG